jgi:hypothetical protein
MRKAGVTFIALLFFFFLIFFLRVPNFVSRANTEYTKNFSYEKFNTVKIGMTEEQVLAILGEPLYRYTDNRIQLSYSKTKNSLSDFTGWESTRVYLNDEHIVIGVASNIFFN